MLDKLKELRKICLQMSNAGRDGNLQSIFSSLEIIFTLYDRVMNWSPENSNSPDRDFFILSKGQATPAQFAVLADKKFFTLEELMTFCKIDSRFSMQADRTKFPEGGIENSAGSLGHGFPMAAGLAWSKKIQGRKNVVYCLAGDGEMNEGTMWETVIFAAAKKLDNLCLIIDDNNSIKKMLDVGDWENKIRSFGFVTESCNGHDPDEIFSALKNLRALSAEKNSPACLVAKTVRGYGSKTLMTDPSWFHRSPDDEELENLLQEVDLFCEDK